MSSIPKENGTILTCDRLRTLGDGMLRKFTRKNQTDGGLDFTRRNGGFLGIGSELCEAEHVETTRV